MSFDFELHFTGICLFDVEVKSRPKQCRVLLVNTTEDNPNKSWLPEVPLAEHEPRLVINAKNYVDPPTPRWEADGTVVSPDGEDCLVFSLAGRNLKLSSNVTQPLRLNAESPVFPAPFARYRSEDRSYRYTLRVPELDTNVGSLLSAPPGRKSPVISRLEFTQGRLASHELTRRHDRFMLYEFKTVNYEDPGNLDDSLQQAEQKKRVIADRLVLRIRNNKEPIKFFDQLSQETLLVGATYRDSRKEMVTASYTNLDKQHYKTKDAIYDFLWYYTLFDWNNNARTEGEKLAIPWPVGYPEAGRTPSSGTCPPGGG